MASGTRLGMEYVEAAKLMREARIARGQFIGSLLQHAWTRASSAAFSSWLALGNGFRQRMRQRLIEDTVHTSTPRGA